MIHDVVLNVLAGKRELALAHHVDRDERGPADYADEDGAEKPQRDDLLMGRERRRRHDAADQTDRQREEQEPLRPAEKSEQHEAAPALRPPQQGALDDGVEDCGDSERPRDEDRSGDKRRECL
ncbi:MAG TPA: hypothetical protein VN766_13160 [Stellaceae bacterium]|jgi:hypothetical protein|nr:hypothetical protein [Stellaceae bacterium]